VASITELSASGSSTAEIDRVWRGYIVGDMYDSSYCTVSNFRSWPHASSIHKGMTLSNDTHCASSFTAGHTANAPMTDLDNPTRRYFDKPTAIIGVEGISLGVGALRDLYSNDIKTLESGMAIADPIAVFWQTSDIAEVFPLAYVASVARQIAATEVLLSQTTGASPSSKSNLATQTGTSTANPADRSSNDLSTGAKAGIAIGVVLGVALVALGALLLFRRRRRKQKLARDTQWGRSLQWEILYMENGLWADSGGLKHRRKGKHNS
jgi:LPXTG-motif cell wall-anchored protein